jgi:hypothetical protein
MVVRELMFGYVALVSFFAFGEQISVSQLPEICLESADHDLSGPTQYNPAIKTEMLNKVGGANFLLDSAHLDQKIKAYHQLFSDPVMRESLKTRLYSTEEIMSDWYSDLNSKLANFHAIEANRERLKSSRDLLAEKCRSGNQKSCLEIAALERQMDELLEQMKSIHSEIGKLNERNTKEAFFERLNKIPLDIVQLIERAANSDVTYPPEFVSATEEKLKKQTNLTDIFANAKAKFADHACDLVVDPAKPKLLKGCLAAAAFLVEQSSPHEVGGEQAAFVPLIRKVLIEPVYVKAAAKMAVKMMKKMEPVLAHPENFESTSQNFGDFFEDMVSSFQEADPTASDQVNKDRAFDLLALYGTRGSGFSFFVYLSQKENLALSPSLNIIAAAVNILNRASLYSDKLYAFPSFVKSHCAVGRPYHFWMAAYLARIAIKTGQFDKESIFSAIHALRVAYKLIGPSSVWQTFFIPELRLGYTFELQKDLVFGALGAYGILQSHNLDFSDVPGDVPVDPLMVMQMNASNFDPPEDAPSILDNLPFYLRAFATGEFKFKNATGKTIERADRMWSAGIAPNAAFKELSLKLSGEG